MVEKYAHSVLISYSNNVSIMVWACLADVNSKYLITDIKIMNNLRFLLPYLYAYLAVAKHQSFTRAADELCVSQSAISYQIKKLEELLGIQLLDRSCRNSVKLTIQGYNLQIRCQSLFLELEDGLLALNEDTNHHSLRIAAPSCLGSAVLTHVVAKMKETQQGLNINLQLDDQCIDLSQHNIDFAIRINNHDPKLQYLPLFNVKMQLVVSSQYMARYGMPKSARGLSEHQIIMGRDEDSDWQQLMAQLPELQVDPNRISYINNALAVLAATRAGLGIAYLPDYLVSDLLASGELKSVFNETYTPINYFICHKKGAMIESQKILFVDYLLQYISKQGMQHSFEVLTWNANMAERELI